MEDLGAFLQQAREERNLSIADIADRTKIRQLYLTAIEKGKGRIYQRKYIYADFCVVMLRLWELIRRK